jgi:hypothetical protein
MAKHLPDSHTGDNLYAEFVKMLQKFNVELTDVVAGTTDGGTNVINAMKSLCGPNGHVPCICHIINAMIRRCLNHPTAKAITTVIDKVKRFVTHLKHSNTAMGIYRKLQTLAGTLESNVKYLIQSVVTRWNSELLCVERFIEMLNIVKNLVADRSYSGPEIPNEEEITILKGYVALMKPFETVTTRLSGDSYVTSK